MYLHLGQDVVVKTEEIIGIFDLETSTISSVTRRFLAGAERAHKVVNVSMEMPKTFVICRNKKHRDTVYISQISSATLRKRTHYISELALLEPPELPGKGGI